MQLHQLAESVLGPEVFLAIRGCSPARSRVGCLSEKAPAVDRYGPEPGGWENVTVETFLEAAHAWAEATNFGARQGLGEASPWKKFAVFLYCGKIYE